MQELNPFHPAKFSIPKAFYISPQGWIKAPGPGFWPQYGFSQ